MADDRFRPDGWNVRWRIGVLTPHADVGPESEFNAMAPAQVGIHAARVPFGAMGAGGAMDPTIPLAPVRAFAEPPYVDDAVDRLAAAPVDTIAFGFTSSAYVIGADGESAMIERLAKRSRGIPVVASCSAAIEALRVLQAERVAVFNPPWFDEELNRLGHDFYASAGFDVTLATTCALPSDQRQIRSDDLYEFVVSRDLGSAEAVVIGGNGFRAVGVIDALEAELGLPVVTANQVLLWAALRAAQVPTDLVTTYGRVFSLPNPSSA